MVYKQKLFASVIVFFMHNTALSLIEGISLAKLGNNIRVIILKDGEEKSNKDRKIGAQHSQEIRSFINNLSNQKTDIVYHLGLIEISKDKLSSNGECGFHEVIVSPTSSTIHIDQEDARSTNMHHGAIQYIPYSCNKTDSVLASLFTNPQAIIFHFLSSQTGDPAYSDIASMTFKKFQERINSKQISIKQLREEWNESKISGSENEKVAIEFQNFFSQLAQKYQWRSTDLWKQCIYRSEERERKKLCDIFAKYNTVERQEKLFNHVLKLQKSEKDDQKVQSDQSHKQLTHVIHGNSAEMDLLEKQLKSSGFSFISSENLKKQYSLDATHGLTLFQGFGTKLCSFINE